MKEKNIKTYKKKGKWSEYTSRTSLNIYAHHQIIEIFSREIENFGEEVIKPLKELQRVDTDFIWLFYKKLFKRLMEERRTLKEIKELNSTYSYLKYVKEKLFYGFTACYDLIMVAFENEWLILDATTRPLMNKADVYYTRTNSTYNTSLIEFWPQLEPESKFYDEQKKYLENKKMKEEK